MTVQGVKTLPSDVPSMARRRQATGMSNRRCDTLKLNEISNKSCVNHCPLIISGARTPTSEGSAKTILFSEALQGKHHDNHHP